MKFVIGLTPSFSQQPSGTSVLIFSSAKTKSDGLDEAVIAPRTEKCEIQRWVLLVCPEVHTYGRGEHGLSR